MGNLVFFVVVTDCSYRLCLCGAIWSIHLHCWLCDTPLFFVPLETNLVLLLGDILNGRVLRYSPCSLIVLYGDTSLLFSILVMLWFDLICCWAGGDYWFTIRWLRWWRLVCWYRCSVTIFFDTTLLTLEVFLPVIPVVIRSSVIITIDCCRYGVVLLTIIEGWPIWWYYHIGSDLFYCPLLLYIVDYEIIVPFAIVVDTFIVGGDVFYYFTVMVRVRLGGWAEGIVVGGANYYDCCLLWFPLTVVQVMNSVGLVIVHWWENHTFCYPISTLFVVFFYLLSDVGDWWCGVVRFHLRCWLLILVVADYYCIVVVIVVDIIVPLTVTDHCCWYCWLFVDPITVDIVIVVMWWHFVFGGKFTFLLSYILLLIVLMTIITFTHSVIVIYSQPIVDCCWFDGGRYYWCTLLILWCGRTDYTFIIDDWYCWWLLFVVIRFIYWVKLFDCCTSILLRLLVITFLLFIVVILMVLFCCWFGITLPPSYLPSCHLHYWRSPLNLLHLHVPHCYIAFIPLPFTFVVGRWWFSTALWPIRCPYVYTLFCSVDLLLLRYLFQFVPIVLHCWRTLPFTDWWNWRTLRCYCCCTLLFTFGVCCGVFVLPVAILFLPGVLFFCCCVLGGLIYLLMWLLMENLLVTLLVTDDCLILILRWLSCCCWSIARWFFSILTVCWWKMCSLVVVVRWRCSLLFPIHYE